MKDLIAFPDSARVWIFQGDQAVPDDRINEVYYSIEEFISHWTSHDLPMTATASILHHRFIVIVLDESKAGVSGCGIDKATHFVQSLGHHLGIDFFDRNRYSYIEDDTVMNVSAVEFKDMYLNGQIDDETMIFDNLVKNKGEFVDHWVRPLKDTWVKRVVLS